MSTLNYVNLIYFLTKKRWSNCVPKRPKCAFEKEIKGPQMRQSFIFVFICRGKTGKKSLPI